MTKNLKISPNIHLTLQNVIGKCIAILGIRGSGKTNTSAVILEELLKNKFPMTIVDIDGEYWGLKEKYEILVVGKSKNVDIEVNVEHAEQIAELSISKNIPIILDMSGFLYEDTYEFLLRYMREIWDLAGKYRKPYEIILEEAHEFIPQGIKNDLKEILTKITLRGRKRGLGIIIISQRSAKVEKDVLTQAEILFLHKVVHPIDKKVYNDILPVSGKKVSKMISELKQGFCIFFFEDSFQIISIRERITFHAGFTPSLKTIKLPKLKVISEEIFKSINSLTKKNVKKKSQIESLNSKIEKLESEITKKNNYIKQLENDVEILGKISIELKQPDFSNINNELIEKLLINENKNSIDLENSKNINLESSNQEYYNEQVSKHIKKILNRLSKISKPKKEMFKFLVNRYPLSYNYSEIADWINYSESTLYKNQPTELIKMGLIKRERKSNGFYFSSNIENFVKNEFNVYFEDNDNIENMIIFLKKKFQEI